VEKEVQEMEEKERQEKRKRGPKLKVPFFATVKLYPFCFLDSFKYRAEEKRWWRDPRKKQVKEKKECNLDNQLRHTLSHDLVHFILFIIIS